AHSHARAPFQDGYVDNGGEDCGNRKAAPEPGLALAILDGRRSDKLLSTQAGEGRGKHHQYAEANDKDNKANRADEVEGLFPLPYLIACIDRVRGVTRFGEERDDGVGRFGAEVRPRVDDVRVVYHAHGFFAVYRLII